jgi:Protein kinase domain
LSELRHPNIVRVLAKSSGGGGSGRFCMVLEFANGGSVHSILASEAKRSRFSPSTRFYVAQSLVAALEYLHTKNMFHRDVKPENMCMYEGWDDNPKMVLIDFGIAARIADSDASVTMTSNPGTQDFMAPEYGDRSRCHFTEKSEVFSIGAVMACLLTGDCSFSWRFDSPGFAIETMLRHVDGVFGEWHSDSAHDFAALINQCTDNNEDQRPTINKLLQALMELRSRHAQRALKISPQSTNRVKKHVSSSRRSSKLPEVKSSSHNCLSCGIRRRQGIMCFGNHFLCCESTCLEDMVRMHKGRGEFPCPKNGCGNKYLLRDFYGKIGESVYSELIFAMDKQTHNDLLIQSMVNNLASLMKYVQEGFSSVKKEVRDGNASILIHMNYNLAAVRSHQSELHGLSEKARKETIEELKQVAAKLECKERTLDANLKAIHTKQMKNLGNPDVMEQELDDILKKLEALSLQNAKGVSLLASGRLQCPRLCLLWPFNGPRRLNMRRLLYKEYRLYFLCAHNYSLVKTSITIKHTKAWVKKIAPVLKFAILSIRMLVNATTGFPVPSLPGFIPGSNSMEQFTEVVEHMEALLEQTETGCLSGLENLLYECLDEDDWMSYISNWEEEISPESYGALAIEAYKPKNLGWMNEMDIVSKGDLFAWVKKENVEKWKAAV